MSKISTIYPAIISSLNTLFPSKTRLHNPYELAENPDIVIKDAWGLKVGNANKETIEFCNLSIDREYTFVLLRHLVSLVSKEDGFDSISVSLLEDQQSFLQLFNSPNELGQEALIDRIEFSSITGVNEMVSGEKKYLFCEVTFRILISESLS